MKSEKVLSFTLQHLLALAVGAAICTCWVVQAEAGETNIDHPKEISVYASLRSWHYVEPDASYGDINEANYGLSAKAVWEPAGSPDVFIHVGGFDNTFNDLSIFGVIGYQAEFSENIAAGFGAGLVSGYTKLRDSLGGVLPAAGVFVQWRAVHVAVLPGVVGFSLELKEF